MSFYFAIIGHEDNYLYSADLSCPEQGFSEELKQLNPFILHSSLDIIEELQWQTTNSNGLTSNSNVVGSTTGNSFLRSRHSNNGDGGAGSCYLSKVDHFYELSIIGYITYGNIKFVMIHGNNKCSTSSCVDDTMFKIFYKEIHELYIKTLMNPFYKVDEAISSAAFDSKVKTLAKKYLIK